MKGRSEYVGLLDKAEGLGEKEKQTQEVQVRPISSQAEAVCKGK